jgi:hypothetical protein
LLEIEVELLRALVGGDEGAECGTNLVMTSAFYFYRVMNMPMNTDSM